MKAFFMLERRRIPFAIDRNLYQLFMNETFKACYHF